jgi:outer membrane protein assembly factor BamB
MQIARTKAMATLIALFLLSAMAISLALPSANAQATSGQMLTFAFVGATPNPVGVGQQTLIDYGISQQLASVGLGWTGMTITVTHPDGTTETLGPLSTDSTGGKGVVYTPSAVGNYTLQVHFPQQTMPPGMPAGSIPSGTVMLASDSPKYTLIVQQQPLLYNPGVPLPAEYWTRPINQQFRSWTDIAGSSMMSNDENQAPLTPHVLWTKPLTLGGLVGGPYYGENGQSVGMEAGDAYEGKWPSRFILNGYLYYNVGPYVQPNLFYCVNVRTGEVLWAKTFLDNRSLSFVQDYYWSSYNYQGNFPYLWVTISGNTTYSPVTGNTWYAFDPNNGNWAATIQNVPSGTMLTNPYDGSIYEYVADLTNGWMALWNMSAMVSTGGSWGSAFALHTFNASATLNSSTTVLTTANARAWAWNITIPKGLHGSIQAVNLTQGKVVGENLVSSTVYRSSLIGVSAVNVWAFSVPTLSPSSADLKATTTGTLLYNTTWTAPADWANETVTWVTTDMTANVGLLFDKDTYTHFAFDLKNGQYLWKTDAMQYLSQYSVSRTIYGGNLYAAGYTGILYCFDLSTGKTKWTLDVPQTYQPEELFSTNWPEFIYFASGGRLYLFHQEHSPNMPLPRLAAALCVNATTGDVIWRVDGLFRSTGWGGTPIMGDSVIADYNMYDEQIYAIGQGTSATTVEAPLTAIRVGDSVTIQGTVMDVSPGTKETSLTLRFPNGVPAVSDSSQGEWMKYIYDQFPYPANATGVPVSIDAVDPNGNFVHLGSVTSDSSGNYGFSWTPPDVPGKYAIIATFAGSGAYYGSYAETYATVSEAPPATPTPRYPVPIDYTMTIVAVAVVLLIAIAIVGILVIRKK